MLCWAVYSCLFPTWVVVISWILELIVILQIYTRNDSRLWERQLITIRLTSVSALIIDNIAGLKCVCVHATVICCMISPSGSVSRWQLAIIWTHFINLHHSVSIFQSCSLSLCACSSPHSIPPVSEDSSFSYYYINALLAWMLQWHCCQCHKTNHYYI